MRSIQPAPAPRNSKAWLRQQIAAAKPESGPDLPMGDTAFVKSSQAVFSFTRSTHGIPLLLPSNALPPLP